MYVILHPRWQNADHRVTAGDETLVFTKGDAIDIESEEQFDAVAPRIGKSLAIAKVVKTNDGQEFFAPDMEETQRFVDGDSPSEESDPVEAKGPEGSEAVA